MIVFPNGKINIGLQIKQKRADGFHDLETIFYPIKVKDVLEIIKHTPIEKENNPVIQFSTSGVSIHEASGANICEKAFHLLQKDFPQITSCQMHLHKTIPIGAGLGGGSADAAEVLITLNKLFNLSLSKQQLINYASMLGSDCPFFIENRPAYATGRGELLTQIPVDLKGYNIFLVHPAIHINTGWAFNALAIDTTHHCYLPDALQLPVNEWKNNIYNDFETPVFAAYPDIQNIKTVLLNEGAVYAALSGSGSSVYGIFKADEKRILNFPAHYFTKWV